MGEVEKTCLEKTKGDYVNSSGSNNQGRDSSTVVELEHNKITRRELEENKNTRNDTTRRIEVQECQGLALNQNGSTMTRVRFI